jgi:hypothetical protein
MLWINKMPHWAHSNNHDFPTFKHKTMVNFTNIFGAKAEQLLRRQFFLLFTATAFGKIVPKYGARHKS